MAETAAEKTFFESGGNDSAAVIAENQTLAPKTDGSTGNIPDKKDEGTQLSLVSDNETSEQKAGREAKKPDKTPAEIAAANAEAQKARQKLLADLGAVPLEALQEARNEGKLTKRELEELKAWKQQIEPLLGQLKPIAKPSEPNPYDPNIQPQEYKQYQEWLDTKQAAAEFKAWKQQDEQRQIAFQQISRASAWAKEQEAEFTKTQPAYSEAYKFAAESRVKELQAMGMNQEQIQNVLYQNQMEIVNLAIQTGKNPAQIVWDLAQQRGFKVESKPVEDKTIQAAQKIQAGQQASGGLKGGSAPEGKVTLEDVARIDTSTPAGRKKYDEMWAKAIG